MEQDLKDFQFLSSSCGHLSSDLFKQLISENNNENAVGSPLSVHIVLFLLFYGSDGTTKQELKSILNLLDPNETQKEIKYLLTFLNNADKIEMQMANAIYIDNDFTLLQDFLNKSKHYFQMSIENFSSKNSNYSSQKINEWVKVKTKGKINNVIGSDDIDEYTKIILISTLYFKSSWLKPFESQFTSKQKFYNIDNTEIYVSTMVQTSHLSYGSIQQFNANFIKLEYLNEQFEMIIILPNEKLGLYKLEKYFDLNLVSKAHYSTKEVKLALPKFTIEAVVNLKTLLNNMGVISMFDKQANFSFMAEEPLKVDKILQKLFIAVDEYGSEAAVATTVQIRSRRMIVDTEDFIVDHPFVFIINHKPSNIPLYIGSIKKLEGTLNKDEL